MNFKHFYYSSKTNKQTIFENVFETYYEKGYFGKIDKKSILEQQKSWFKKFLLILEEGDQDTLKTILSNRDNLTTRAWFSEIYKEDILEKSRSEIGEVLKRILK